jgi:hypothetical protein
MAPSLEGYSPKLCGPSRESVSSRTDPFLAAGLSQFGESSAGSLKPLVFRPIIAEGFASLV